MILWSAASVECGFRLPPAHWINQMRILTSVRMSRDTTPIELGSINQTEWICNRGCWDMKPAAWLANKAGILQLPSERYIFFIGLSSEQQAFVLSLPVSRLPHFLLPASLIPPLYPMLVLALAHLFPPSQPHSLTRQRHDWLSIVNSSLVLQDRDYVGVCMLYCAEDRLHEHNENLNEKSWTDHTRGFACFIPTTVNITANPFVNFQTLVFITFHTPWTSSTDC